MPNLLKPVLDADLNPAVCHLSINRNKFAVWSGGATGSGILIDSRHVLTAAHNIASWKLFNVVKYIDVRVGKKSVNRAMPAIRSEALFVPKYYMNWRGKTNFNYDYGLIRLSAPVESVAPVELSEVGPELGDHVRVIGYPGDKSENISFSGYELFEGSGEVLTKPSLQFEYDVDTATGLSGAAILNNDDRVVGVHTRSASQSAPGGARTLDDDSLKILRRWMSRG